MYYDNENPTEDQMWEELNSALMYLLNHGMIESGVDEDGEIVFWMTEEQIAKFGGLLD